MIFHFNVLLQMYLVGICIASASQFTVVWQLHFAKKGCLFDPFCSYLQDKRKQSYLNRCLGAIMNFFKNVEMRISV